MVRAQTRVSWGKGEDFCDYVLERRRTVFRLVNDMRGASALCLIIIKMLFYDRKQ